MDLGLRSFGQSDHPRSLRVIDRAWGGEQNLLDFAYPYLTTKNNLERPKPVS